ncbi:hypothetical protein G6F60_012511 [Rhizopus arrhizus]|nr:hypothetical protein G6F60_012511 [Rhizopus arrhizus]
MTTLHGGLTNHNPLLPTTQNTSPTSQGRIAIAPTTRTESANLWKTFTAFLRSMRGTNVTVLEDVDAKAATHLPVTPALFYAALAEQYPSAIGTTPVRQGTTNATVIAFDSAEDRTQACIVGVVVDPFTIHGTPTLSAESTVYRLSLDKLPLLRQTDLTPLLKETLSQYGKC